MITKTITYTDYNGVERTEKFNFHLNKAEIIEMELGTAGGFAEHIQKIIDAKDAPELIKLFKELVLKSYGEKSPDGKKFIKNQELTESFVQTEAYPQLFMELATNDEKAAEFVNGIFPADLVEMAKAEMEKNQLTKN